MSCMRFTARYTQNVPGKDLFYDTRSDLSQTTCWIRQNLRMFDRVSPSKAYDTRSDMSYTEVSNGVLEGDTRSNIPRFCHIQQVVCYKSDRVS